MTHKYIFMSVAIAGIFLIGAACTPKKTVTVQNNNVNQVVNLNTNTSIETNTSTTTGSFGTSTNNSTADTITFSASGVSPSILTVAKGTIVTFMNSDSARHQIASNPHPTHTDLPGFDGSIASGSTYSFTFSQTGTFGYHDHLDPFNTNWQGEIIVQ